MICMRGFLFVAMILSIIDSDSYSYIMWIFRVTVMNCQKEFMFNIYVRFAVRKVSYFLVCM